jgi:hypothetical protein
LEERITITKGSKGNKFLGRTHTKQVFGKVGNKASSFWEGWKARNKATSFWETRQEIRHVKKTIKNI